MIAAASSSETEFLFVRASLTGGMGLLGEVVAERDFAGWLELVEFLLALRGGLIRRLSRAFSASLFLLVLVVEAGQLPSTGAAWATKD
jgi:hypothetical protein